MELTKSKESTIVTHDGKFHGDDVLACMIMAHVSDRNIIIRTRDQDIISTADYVIDVGRDYDGNTKFDHHQFDEKSDMYGKAAAGLVWYRYGYDYIRKLDPTIDDRILGQCSSVMAEGFVGDIDKGDLGILEGRSSSSMSTIISAMNVGDDVNQQFTSAMQVMQKCFDATLLAAIDRLKSVEEVLNSEVIDGNILVLKRGMACKQIVSEQPEFDSIKFIVIPQEKGDYRIVTVPISGVKGFSSRMNFPKEWADLQSDELSENTGIPGCIFCHKGLFIAGHETREGAIALAKLAISKQ